ncbi:hypothetical protein HPB52_008700 [Rhipicephalus sanguineus]|uniref:Uncharacterized protein n=1 Tax=Rhipicephalus sanguineus TaxID=34632 RepID=A0A9D4PV88_RHISA|nr:hypothetical protein HPB52_008700 [Rhipicephalus sanguineus]
MPARSGIAYAQKSTIEPNHACHSQWNIFNGSDKRRRWRMAEHRQRGRQRKPRRARQRIDQRHHYDTHTSIRHGLHFFKPPYKQQ